ncbi:MAG TPA: GIY-YIG nuclease family protein [Acidobacteriaceae bacterium]|jgi:putative endonuclease|nr:GIY-YIG nuclease family protein [Acidobacteriaceae bacterium]
MRDRSYFVYIMASRSRVLYIGITNSIRRRNTEHKERKADSFTAQHRCTRLVLYEIYCSPSRAIAREKQLKGWTRAKKIALIEQTNPQWNDLSQDWEANTVILTEAREKVSPAMHHLDPRAVEGPPAAR